MNITPADAAGPCVACRAGTDTALAFAGEPEFCQAGLVVLGVPEAEARSVFADRYADEDGLFPSHLEVLYRACAECVAKSPAGFPTPFLTVPGAEIPAIRPID